MKTKEELNTLKEEVETLNKKLAELNEDEMKQVSGGLQPKPGPVGAPTAMKCTNQDCGYSVNWAGLYSGKTFECPVCHQHTLTGQ